MLRRAIIFILVIGSIFAQDFQVEHHRPFELPVLPDSLSFEEFQLINRDLGWKELFTTIIFPGYASKFAKEDSVATYVIVGRYLGLAAMGGVTLNALFNPEVESSSFQKFADKSSANAAVFIGGLSSNIMLTIFDWGYANLKLKQKQEEVLFKYKQKSDTRTKADWGDIGRIPLPSIPQSTP